MRRIAVIALMFVCFFAPCVCVANPADAYSTSEGMYIGTFGKFNDAIGDYWEQTAPYGIDDFHDHFHQGVDIGADEFTELKALGDGYVKEAGWIDPTGYGLLVTIHYPWALTPDGSDVGMDVMYGHLAALGVHAGDTVHKGQTVAYVGNTGRSTGPHTHMEVSYGNSGQTVDPALYFTDLKPGSIGDGSGKGTGGTAMHRLPSFDFELKVDLINPVRDIFEEIIKAATAGLHLIEGAVKNLFIILITIDLALGLGFYLLNQDMQERTGFLSYFAYKMLFYGFLLFFLTHWGDYVGNFSRDLFTESAAIMINRSQTEIAEVISSPTDVMAKGLHVVSPIFSQLLKDSGSTLGFGLGFAAVIGFLILVLFIIIGWHLALAYIEFYLMVLFGFTTFLFAGERHLRIHSENGINGIIASAINLMFFCFFAVTLQGVMADLSVDSIFTTTNRAGQEIAYRHPSMADPNNAGIPPPPDGLPIFLSKIRMVETGGCSDPYHTWSGDVNEDDGLANSYGAYQIQPGNWINWAEAAYDAGYPIFPDGGGYPTNGTRGYSRFSWSPTNQDIVASYRIMEYYKEFGNWHDCAVAWNGGGGAVGKGWSETESYWAKVSGASASQLDQIAAIRTAVNINVLLRLFLVVLMFMLIGDRIGQLVMNSFGCRGFTFRMNS